MGVAVSGRWVCVSELWVLGPRVLMPGWRSGVSWWETSDITLLQRGVLGNVGRIIWREGGKCDEAEYGLLPSSSFGR